MAASFTANFGNFIPIPEFVLRMKLSNAARHVYGVLANFQNYYGEAYVSRKIIQEKTNLAATTISTAVTELQNNDLLRRTGQFKYGSFPIVEIFLHPKSGVSEPKLQYEPEPTEDLAAANPIEEEEPQNLEKQQQNAVVSINTTNPEEQEKILQHLKSFGLGSNVAKRLIAAFPIERIRRQIAQLDDLLARGHSVNNQAGWLINAIRQNYRPHKEQEASGEDQADQKRKTAYQLIQDAEQLERQNKLPEARLLAEKSLSLNPQAAATSLIKRIDALREREARQTEAVLKVPKEEFAQILVEEEENQRLLLRRFGIEQLGEMGKKAAFQAALSRLTS